eukprot:4288-Heterococcus_DN1.PRE.3
MSCRTSTLIAATSAYQQRAVTAATQSRLTAATAAAATQSQCVRASSKKQNKPNKSVGSTLLTKHFRKSVKAIRAQLTGSSYRSDLTKDALARYQRVYKTVKAQSDTDRRARISTGRTTQEVRLAEKAKAAEVKAAQKAASAGAGTSTSA